MIMEKVLKYIREQRLLRAGDRVAVACSGGADSVALLRILADLREELGIVLSVAHFHHQIRGAEADADKQFVADLAAGLQLAFIPAQAMCRRTPLHKRSAWKRPRGNCVTNGLPGWFSEVTSSRGRQTKSPPRTRWMTRPKPC